MGSASHAPGKSCCHQFLEMSRSHTHSKIRIQWIMSRLPGITIEIDIEGCVIWTYPA